MRPTSLTVLMTADTLGGVWDYALELAANLRRYGVRTILATMGGRPRADQRQAAVRTADLQLEESGFRLEWMSRAAADVQRAGTWLLQLEKKWQPDVVHLNGYAHASLPWKAPCLVAAHSCVLSWWRAVRTGPPPDKWAEYASWVKNGLRDAAWVIAPTNTFLQEIKEIYGPLPTGLYIHNGRNPVKFLPAKKENFILSAGRIWDEAKNIGAMEKAARRLPWPVAIAGDWNSPEGDSRQPVRASFLGHLPAAAFAAQLSRAAIYALPARYEPFGLTVLEAALSGCTLVLGDIATLRELWDGAAVFVPPDDHQALTDAINGLIAHPRRRAALGLAARRRARRYSGARMARSYLTVYHDLCNRRQRHVRDNLIACA